MSEDATKVSCQMRAFRDIVGDMVSPIQVSHEDRLQFRLA